MSYCINVNHPEYLELLETSNLKPALLKAKIAVWMQENNSTDFPTLEELNVSSGSVNATLKIIDALEKIQRNVFTQDKLQGWINDLQKQGVSAQQLELFKEVVKPGMTRDEIATSIAANYSYTVEINTATKDVTKELNQRLDSSEEEYNSIKAEEVELLNSPGITKTFYKTFENNTYTKTITTNPITGKEEKPKYFISSKTINKTDYYSNLTVPGGTNYTEQEIATPAITPSIKGHAQFATDKGIGWFRSDEQTSKLKEELEEIYKFRSYSNEEVNQWTNLDKTKTRRILEVQSDLFQKGRKRFDLTSYDLKVGDTFETDKGLIEVTDILEGSQTINIKNLTTGVSQYLDRDTFITAYKNKIGKNPVSKNDFLQLLNKDSNWVTFFVKSIIQDSAKKGYEKVLFPSGDTASKVEGHTTLETYKKQKEDRIKSLESIIEISKKELQETPDLNTLSEKGKESVLNGTWKTNIELGIKNRENEITQLKQELKQVEGPEGFGALKPIWNFYENTVSNILKKQGYSPKQFTDEYGNTWNEVEVKEEQATNTIFYQKDEAKFYQQKAKDIFFNEVRGKQLSNNDIININSKLRRLSDQIGDATWSLRMSQNTGNYYIAGYGNKSVTRDDYYSPYAGGMFRQRTTKSLESRVEELDKKLMSWAKKHGISVEALKAVMEKFPDRYDGTALGIADFAKNLIAIGDGARIDTLPEEVAHFAIELLIKDPTVVQALEEVVSTPEYAEVKEDYKDIYEEEIDFRKEALGKILAQEIVTNFKQAQENPNNSFWSKILDIANKFFNWVGINFSKKAPARTAIEAVVMPLANSILNQEYLGTADNVDLSMEDYATEKSKILYQVTPNAQPVSNSNVEQKKKFLEEVVLKLTSRVNRFKNTAKSQTEIAALTIEIEKLQKLVAQSEFDLGISSFAQLASKELDSILAYLNKSLKNKTLNGQKLGLAQEFEEVYTSLFLELKQSMYEYEFEEDDIEALTAIIDNVENKLKQAEAMTKTLRKMLTKRVLEKGNLNAYGEKIDPNFNSDEVTEATDEDMSSWRLWLGNYKFSNSGIIRTAHKIIFDSIAKVKRFTVQTGNEILQAQEKFIKAGYKIDELVQKDKDGKATQYFVREINYSSYYAAIQETKANIAKALGRDDYSLIQVSLLEKDEKDVYNKFWNQFFINNTKKVTNVNPDGTVSEARMPSDKYLEKDFLKKMEDPSFSEYYNLIIAKKREAVNKLPVQYRTENLIYSLPAIRKSFLERIGSKDQSYLSKIKGITKESFFVDQDDTIFGDLQALNNKMVPIHFTRKFDNISDLSFDIARTVTLFAEMAENYKEMNAISGDLTAVQSTLAERKYGKKKGIQSADYEALETMLDTHVFGVEKKNVNFTIPENDFTKKIGINNKQFSWTKASQRFTSFMRTNNLAFNPATSIAGWLKGSGDSIIEDQIGIYTTNESKNWSRVEFMSNLGHVIGEIGKPKQTNKMHLILQENEIVDINRMLFETTKNRVTRKTLNRDVFYVTFASGDYGLKGRATLAVYDNHRLYNDQFITRAKFYEKTAKEKGVTNDKKHQKEVGKEWESLREKSLYNAYEVVDGQLKVKDEFAPFIPDALANSIKGKVEHLANYLDGTLSPTDKGKLSRGIAGDFLLMHRGWFIGMMDTRLKRNNVNMISEEEEVGTYRATGSFLVEAFKQSLVKDKNLKGFIVAWNNLSDPYKRGCWKTVLDLFYLNIAALAAAIFNAAADDADDDDFTLQYTAYQLNRLLLEQGAAWSPAELIQMIDEPVVGARFIKDVLDITEAFNFGEVYKAGIYEDKSHARKWWMKKLPTRNLYELQFPELKNKFIKNLIDSHYYEYLSDEQKHSIISKKSMFDWLIPFNEGYSEELQQNNVRQVVDYLEQDNQEEYNEFN